MVTDFASSIRNIEVDNVFIYVGDAVRWDYLPDEFSERGAVFKTVAASTHSPTSFASLVTGRNPFTHGVSSFKNQIKDDIFRLFDIDGYHTKFINSILHEGHQDPIFSVLGIDQPKIEKNIENISSPYIVMERGQGGHAPYNPEFATAGEYFRSVCRKGKDTIRRDYQNAVKRDERKFLDRIEELGIDDDTLVIYTSDHGELLGEGGMIGHTSPMRPELVYVPTVFIHPDLPTGVSKNFLFRHIDLLPTIVDILDCPRPDANSWVGSPLTSGRKLEQAISKYDHRYLSLEVSNITGNIRYEGVWDRNGGHVFARSSIPSRLSFLAGKLVNSDKRTFLRRNLISAIQSYSLTRKTYGSPSIPREVAVNQVESDESLPTSREELELSESALEHLRDLGYR